MVGFQKKNDVERTSAAWFSTFECMKKYLDSTRENLFRKRQECEKSQHDKTLTFIV